MTEFTALGLAAPLLQALEACGYTTPTPIQRDAIPALIEGHDLLGIAQTGTGKTAAFALPMLQKLDATRGRTPRRAIRALILAPTRELASQIEESIRDYGKFMRLSSRTAFGGVPIHRQISALANGLDILVATPGRLIDLIERDAIFFDFLEVLVVDEADQMMDMGFIKPLRRIVDMLPKDRQTLFFSATMPKEIRSLADSMLRDPVEVRVAPSATPAERIDQKVIHIDPARKVSLLRHLLDDSALNRVIVFARTKHGADRVVKSLERMGVPSASIHGNRSQAQRERALDGFRRGGIRLLIATDIAARGIDIDDISHVINYDLPNVPETYVHRIGRTARAGAEGQSISFCTPEERPYLKQIERTIRRPLDVMENPLGQRSAAEIAAERQDAPVDTKALMGQSRGEKRSEARQDSRKDGRPARGSRSGKVFAGRAEREPREWTPVGERSGERAERPARGEQRDTRPARGEFRDARPARDEQRDTRPARADFRDAGPAREDRPARAEFRDARPARDDRPARGEFRDARPARDDRPARGEHPRKSEGRSGAPRAQETRPPRVWTKKKPKMAATENRGRRQP